MRTLKTGNVDALTLTRQVGETPGFKLEEPKAGVCKLTRMRFRGLRAKTVSVRTKGSDQSTVNNAARIRRELFWTPELRDDLEEITRRHRIEGTDPAGDVNQRLAEAFGIKEEGDPVLPEQKVNKQRHGGGGTPTGSAKPVKVVAQPGTPTPPEAPQVLTGHGRVDPEMITPERAIELLSNLADYQRKLREKKRDTYAAAMRRKEWVLNAADPICIDTNGKTANGLHRLNAVVEVEEPQPFYVAYDVPPETYQVMDRGLKRSAGDSFYGAGEKNPEALAAVCKLATLWFNGVPQSEWQSTEVSEVQAFELLDEHPTIRESVRLGRIKRVTPTAAMFVHYLISQKCEGQTKTATAWYKAIETMDLPKGQPGHTLGLYFLEHSESAKRRVKVAKRTQRELHMYLLIRAWNKTCLGQEHKTCSWKPDFVIPDPLAPGVNASFPPQ